MATIGYEDVKGMDVADLYALNKSVVELIRVKNKERELRAGSDFSPGDVARFDSKKAGRLVHIVIDSVLPKSVHGYEMLQDGTPGTLKWRVSPSICVKTSKADAIDSMKPKMIVPPSPLAIFREDEDEEEEEKTPVAAEPPAPPSDPARDRPGGSDDAW